MEKGFFNKPYKIEKGATPFAGAVIAVMTLSCSLMDITPWQRLQEETCVQQSYTPVSINDNLRARFYSRLESFLDLEDGWDGYDSHALSKTTYDNVKNVIERLGESIIGSWKMFPADNGTIMFVLKERVVGTVNIGNNTVSYIAKTLKGDVIMKGYNAFDVDNVVKLMSEIVVAVNNEQFRQD